MSYELAVGVLTGMQRNKIASMKNKNKTTNNVDLKQFGRLKHLCIYVTKSKQSCGSECANRNHADNKTQRCPHGYLGDRRVHSLLDAVFHRHLSASLFRLPVHVNSCQVNQYADGSQSQCRESILVHYLLYTCCPCRFHSSLSKSRAALLLHLSLIHI